MDLLMFKFNKEYSEEELQQMDRSRKALFEVGYKNLKEKNELKEQLGMTKREIDEFIEKIDGEW